MEKTFVEKLIRLFDDLYNCHVDIDEMKKSMIPFFSQEGNQETLIQYFSYNWAEEDPDLFSAWENMSEENRMNLIDTSYAPQAFYHVYIFSKIKSLCDENNVSCPDDFWEFYNKNMTLVPSY